MKKKKKNQEIQHQCFKIACIIKRIANIHYKTLMKIDVIVIIDSRLERLWQFCKCVKRETLVKFAVTAYHIFWHVDISKVKEKLTNTRIELYIENESFFVSRINEKRFPFQPSPFLLLFFFFNKTFFSFEQIREDKDRRDFFSFNFGDASWHQRSRKRVDDVNLSRHIPRPFESH